MTRALIITDCDPIGAGYDRRARLTQTAQLYRDFGLGLDVIFLAGRDFEPVLERSSALVLDDVRQIGVLPLQSRHHHRDRDNPYLFDLIAGLRGTREPYTAIHLDQVLFRPKESLGRTWIADCYDAPFDGAWDDRKFDLLFAAFDEGRSRNSDLAVQSVRLPLAVPPDPVPHTGEMIGWVGRFSSALADRWSDLLNVLAERGVRLHGGILLAGAGAKAIAVPASLSSSVVRTETPTPGAERALALAVLPSDGADRWIARATLLIDSGCPVLTVGKFGHLFEGRWHLPTHDEAGAFADTIGAWCEGLNRNGLIAATNSTADAFDYDRLAMQSYVKDSLGILNSAPIKV